MCCLNVSLLFETARISQRLPCERLWMILIRLSPEKGCSCKRVIQIPSGCVCICSARFPGDLKEITAAGRSRTLKPETTRHKSALARLSTVRHGPHDVKTRDRDSLRPGNFRSSEQTTRLFLPRNLFVRAKCAQC